MTGAERLRGLVPVAVSAVPLVAALALTYRDGGYFIGSWGVACIVLLGALATAALVWRSSLGGLPGMIALAGWGALAAWQGLSSLWADEPSAAMSAMSLTLLYAAAFGLVLVASDGAPTLRRLLELSLGVAVVVGVSSVGQRLLPDLLPGAESGGRLATPISYWNALGLVFAFGLVLAIGIAGDPTRGPVVRALCAAPSPLFALGILFTQSRGALLVTVLGLALLIAVAPGRLTTVWAALVAGLVSVPLMAYANDQASLRAENVLTQPHADAGGRVAVALLVAAAVCAAASLYVRPLAQALAGGRRARIAGAVVAACAVLVLLGAWAARPPEGGPVSWADRQFDAFRTFDPGARNEAQSVSDRLVVAAGSGRWQNWAVAWREFEDDPAAGTGAGDYRFRWAEFRDIDISVRNAHSLYLETLGESGVVGLLLLLTPLAVVGAVIALALRAGPPPALARDLGIVAGAGGAVALHLAGDWGWQMPAVVLPAIALGAAAIVAGAHHLGRDRPAPAWVPWTVAAVALAGVVLTFGPVASAERLESARDRAAAGDLTGALAAADQAADLDPQSPAPRLLQANLLADLGRPAQADRAFAAAVRRSPRDWTARADWAAALIRRGDRASAAPLVAVAAALNPREQRVALLREAVRTRSD